VRELREGKIYETIYGVETKTPAIPAKSLIGNYKLPPAKQKFELAAFDPARFEPTRFDEKKFAKLDKEQKLAFVTREGQRRLNGYWLYLNGELAWLPGGYYFELVYWHIDVGLKDYRDRDRRKWLFWNTCVGDTNSFGCIYMKHRRDGATHWANCINYETASRTKNALNAIQSKTGSDAKKVFNKLVLGFRKMASIFRPIFDGQDRPKMTLAFEEPATRTTKAQHGAIESEALDTSISHYPTVEEAVDGIKILFYHGDEFGKCQEMDVSKAWPIIKECLSVGAGTRIVGKGLITSTVAEGTKKGGNEFKKLWDQSDPLKRTKNGRTLSGLFRLFISAADGLEGFIGEYGESIIDAPTPEQLAYLRRSNPGFPYQEGVGALQHILNERQGYRDAGDAEGLAGHRRLYPLTESDAFTPPSNECHFDSMKLDAQGDVLLLEDKPRYVRGEFGTVDGEPDGEVVFRPSANGNWYLNKHILRYDEKTGARPGYEHANQVVRRGDLFFPANKTFGKGGVDPVDHDRTTDAKRGSKFAMTVFRNFDLLDPHNSHKFIATYVHRPGKIELAYEDALLCARYFGIELLVENQKPGFEKYVKQRGYWAFIMARPKHTHSGNTKMQLAKGVPASDLIHEQIHDEWEAYIYDHSDKIDFPDMIEDLKGFDINKTTAFDLTMAGGYALIAARKFKPPTSMGKAGTGLGSYVRTFNKR
jgi:hypothetical protein